jgi:hypothetical protein
LVSARVWIWALIPIAIGCASEQPEVSGRRRGEEALERLRAFERARRASTDFAHLAAGDERLGADPYAIRALPDGRGYVGILRGRASVVLLDTDLGERARVPGPESPTGIAVAPSGDVFVSGEASPAIHRYRSRDGRLEPSGTIPISGVIGVRSLALGPEDVLYAVAEASDLLIAIHLRDGARIDRPLPMGPIQIVRTRSHVVVNCLLGHALVVDPVDAAGDPIIERRAAIVHDGPFWGFDALDTPNGLLVAAGGIEDHPLDRRGGSFGYIDSFVFLFRIAPGAQAIESIGEVNVSNAGVVTPKAVRFMRPTPAIFAAGYGGDRAAVLELDEGASKLTLARTIPVLSGMNALEDTADSTRADRDPFVAANPLIDAWTFVGINGDDRTVPIPDGDRSRSKESRLGEALFFTTRMAPWNKSEGPLSRFTCEACHFEGYVDGRVHHTGRGDIRATTKPLLGLHNNRPYFSRALDRDLVDMTDNEFRAAGAKSDHSPWFRLAAASVPWIDFPEPTIDPPELRRALMTFFMDFSHRPNPRVIGRTTWTDLEKEGARAFAHRCEPCHSARLISDDPQSRVPFEAWEERVMSREGAIVWGRSGYEKTGVVPYVHASGARVPSLRRLYKKRPYFTNGSAATLDAVLERARFGATPADRFFHDGAPEDPTLDRLGASERSAIRAFLDLL